MDFHTLDLIMYILLSLLIWYVILPKDWTTELGTLIGWFIMLIFTILYLILFAIYPDWNWGDIFNGFGVFSTKINFKL